MSSIRKQRQRTIDDFKRALAKQKALPPSDYNRGFVAGLVRVIKMLEKRQLKEPPDEGVSQ